SRSNQACAVRTLSGRAARRARVRQAGGGYGGVDTVSCGMRLGADGEIETGFEAASPSKF
ncbi:hypothetical protein KQH52_06045, partial [Mycetohabitans sp. B7]|uniref:hypothetical protein n=1 Tax=Mycetohabitans sp. B7 TaxID=2841844 RepID=UPI001F212510